MSETIAITDALVDLLNAQTLFPIEFTAARIEKPISDLTALKELKVSFMPATRKVKIVTRAGKTKQIGQAVAGRSREYRIDGAVQLKFAPAAGDADIEPYIDLAEEIADFVLGRELAGVKATCTEAEHPYLFFPDHWEKRLFTSIMAFTYKVGP